MGSGEAGGNAWFSLCPDIVNVLRLLRLVACALATYDEALALGKQRKVGMRIGHFGVRLQCFARSSRGAQGDSDCATDVF